MMRAKIKALCLWFLNHKHIYREDAEIDLLQFIDVQMRAQQSLERSKEQVYKSKPSVSKESVKILDEFSSRRKDWMKFRKAFIAYLGSTMNSHNIPLTYMIWGGGDEKEDADIIRASNAFADAIRDAPHYGDAFNCNSYRVY